MNAFLKLWRRGRGSGYELVPDDDRSSHASLHTLLRRVFPFRLGQRKFDVERKGLDPESCQAIPKTESALANYVFLVGHNADIGIEVEHTRLVLRDTGSPYNIIHKEVVDDMLSGVNHGGDAFNPASNLPPIKGYGGGLVEVIGIFRVRFDVKDNNKHSKYPWIDFMVVDDPRAREPPIIIGFNTMREEEMLSIGGPMGNRHERPPSLSNHSHADEPEPSSTAAYVTYSDSTRNHRQNITGKDLDSSIIANIMT
jgi:hypothetical protein